MSVTIERARQIREMADSELIHLCSVSYKNYMELQQAAAELASRYRALVDINIKLSAEIDEGLIEIRKLNTKLNMERRQKGLTPKKKRGKVQDNDDRGEIYVEESE